MNREEFLARVRAASAAVHDPYSRPITPIERPPRVRYAESSDDVVGLFAAKARALGVAVETSPDTVSCVRAAIAQAEVVLVTDEPDVVSLGDLVPGREIRWPECGIAEAARADVAVTGAAAAIAVTGSIVLSSLVGRTAGLLPPKHVVVVRRESIVRTPGEVLRGLPRGTLPSGVVLATGPSRSADIEHKLAIGVHGPGEVVVVLK